MFLQKPMKSKNICVCHLFAELNISEEMHYVSFNFSNVNVQ